MKKFAVLGSPIEHSLSPEIHNLFSRQTGIDLTYEAIEVSESSFVETVNRLFNLGYDGLNITLPLKGMAFENAIKTSVESTQIKAVNTLWIENNEINGHSTDGGGLVMDLSLKGLEIRENSVLIIGAGAAARSIIPALIKLKPAKISIANRTSEKAIKLAQDFKSSYAEIYGTGLELKNHLIGYDAIINTSSHEALGSSIEFSNIIFKNTKWFYDLMYAKSTTSFVKNAKKNGVKNSCDGIGMLIAQAALSFEIWTGIKPEIGTIMDEFTDN